MLLRRTTEPLDGGALGEIAPDDAKHQGRACLLSSASWAATSPARRSSCKRCQTSHAVTCCCQRPGCGGERQPGPRGWSARRAAAAVMASLLCPTGPDAASNGTEMEQQLHL
jgi:hypothetical protein